MRAIILTEHGPDGLRIQDIAEPVPTGGQSLIRVSSAGINFSDVHIIEGTYTHIPTLPHQLGIEAVGTTPDGRRLLMKTINAAWAEFAVSNQTTEVPDFVSDRSALAAATQGFTAWHILRTSARVARGETVAVMAAAGGVGSIAVQLAKAWGAGRVIAAASTPEKRGYAEKLGADATVDSTAPDLGAALVEANGGRLVDVILEMQGGQRLDSALVALAPCGRLVTYGATSGEKSTPIHPETLMAGSRSIVGFNAYDLVTARPTIYRETMTGLFGMVKKGHLDLEQGQSYPFDDVRQAVIDMRARSTVGKVTLDLVS